MTRRKPERPQPRADSWSEGRVIDPPSTVTTFEDPPKPLLYRPDGTPLKRDTRIGFK